jgi:hypothetical protein
MQDEIEQRLEDLEKRLRSHYASIGQSSGRPYIYFVYPPSRERFIQRRCRDQLRSDEQFAFYHIDILPLLIQSTRKQEEVRQRSLNTPLRAKSATESILDLWTRTITNAICVEMEKISDEQRPVAILHNLAALHPLGTPTTLMELMVELKLEPRNPKTDEIIPIVLLIPGFRPPHTSRLYNFLDQERLQRDFYRGEEI